MGRGGRGQTEPSVFNWDEIKSHDSKQDRWIVIDGEVYDVTNWAKKHPGGSTMIGHYAGQDATEAFNAFHNDLPAVKKYLKPIRVGAVEKYEDTEINKDFRKLKETALKMGLFTPSYTFFTIVLLHIILLDVAGYLTMYYFGTGWIQFFISLALVSAAQSQGGWSQHDYGHLSVFRKTKLDHALHHFLTVFMKAQTGWNQHDFGHLSVFRNSSLDHFFHQLTMGFIQGASASWWNHMHYQHHAKPNIIGKDPDVRLDALFVVGDVMPVEVAKSRKKSMPFNMQHRYFFAIGPPLLFPVYFQFMLFRHMITRKLWMELVICLLFYIKFFYLYVPLLGLGWTIVFYELMRCIESHWFTWVAQSNHIPMNIKNDEANPWLKLQMHATCDIEKSFFNDWFTGHLNFQIEHHLFPTMPRHNLYKVAPYVKSLCKKHDIPYIVKPLGQSFKDIYSLFPTMPRHNLYKVAPYVKSLCKKHDIPYIVKPLGQSFKDIYSTLKSSGELWKETYSMFHSD